MAVPRRSNVQSMRRLLETKKEKTEEKEKDKVPTLSEICSSSITTSLFQVKKIPVYS